MGTRATLQVQVSGTPLLTVYRQYDGYLSGMGNDILQMISKEYCNGCQDSSKQYNGIYNLAAMLVVKLNIDNVYGEDVHCGNVYIKPPSDHNDDGNDYAYTVNFNEELNSLSIKVSCYGEDLSEWLSVDEFKALIESESEED